MKKKEKKPTKTIVPFVLKQKQISCGKKRETRSSWDLKDKKFIYMLLHVPFFHDCVVVVSHATEYF